MPRVKIDYIVSFSSEDAENPASNLLGWEVSKKRWLCAKGEPSCSVVLQLTKAVKISELHVGAHHAALVEVLVGRSESPSQPFQVLVPSCVFVSPGESRRDAAVERVRSFAAEQLAAAAAAQRWDRVRLVCSQPYNKHCKYGLSFVQIYEPEGKEPPHPPPAAAAAPAPAPAPAAAAAPLLSDSDDDDDLRPGAFFAKYQLSQSSQSSDTGAQIRQATSQALKNISDSSTKLVKASLAKNKRQSSADGDFGSNRQRDGLMYAAGDDSPHDRIDRVLQRHKEQKAKDEPGASKKDKHNASKNTSNDTHDTSKNTSNDSHRKEIKTEKHTPSHDRRKGKAEQSEGDRSQRKDINTEKHTPGHGHKRKAAEESEDSSRPSHGPDQARAEPSASNAAAEKRPRQDADQGGCGGSRSALLRGVVLSLSGYVHPERGRLRALALRMGARVCRDWGPACNMLVCAFDNTPKLQQVRAGPGGARVPVVRGAWLHACWGKGTRLPTGPASPARSPGPKRSRSPARSPTRSPTRPSQEDQDCDTDDEIEKALNKQKRRIASPTPAQPDGHLTDEDPDVKLVEHIDPRAALPDMFEGLTFVLRGGGGGHGLLRRYIGAYGGLVLQEDQLDDDSTVDYVVLGGGRRAGAGAAAAVGAGAAAGALVPAAWVWRCHEAGALLPAPSPS